MEQAALLNEYTNFLTTTLSALIPQITQTFVQSSMHTMPMQAFAQPKEDSELPQSGLQV